jgi:hypothetical protein
MNPEEVFEKSRALKLLSTSAIGYVDDVRLILKSVIDPTGKQHPWKYFAYDRAGQWTECRYEEFTDYLKRWSRLNLQQLRDLFRSDAEITDLLDVACQKTGGARNDLVYNVHEVVDKQVERPAGNSKEAGLRRLRKERPDLHEKVLAGEISVNKASIEAGFRKKASLLEQTLTLYSKLTDAEKQRFLDEIQSNF